MTSLAREFLESSSIHGLAYIGSTRRLVRVLWVCVVISGFTLAGLLINQAFSDWATSPISTTIETLSISSMDFPNVTVCPPRNSFTTLNPDLVRARNITLDEEKKKILGDFASETVFEAMHNVAYLELLEFSPAGSYLEWYRGVSKVATPYTDENNYKLQNIDTNTLSGSFSTAYFRQPFTKTTFQGKFRSTVLINVPDGLSEGTKIVISIEYDIEEIHSTEYIRVALERKKFSHYSRWSSEEFGNLAKNEKRFEAEYLAAEYSSGKM